MQVGQKKVAFPHDMTAQEIGAVLDRDRKRAEQMARFIERPDYYGEMVNPVESMKTAATSGVLATPIVGDVVGLGMDLDMYMNDPSSRTWFNYMFTAAGILPGIPAASQVRAARDKIKLYRGESPQVSDPRSPWWTEDIGRAELYGDVRSIEVDPEKRLVLDKFVGRDGNITDTEVNPDGMRELRRILGDEKAGRLDKGEFAHSVLDDADYAKIKESGYDSVVFGDDEGIQDYIIGGGPPRKIKAFHGSPHDFPPVRELKMPDGERVYQSMADAVPDGAEVLAEHPLGRFDMSKLGTGEGAQAYGHGLYFADSEDVAKQYRDELSKGISYDGKPIYKSGKQVGSTGSVDLDDDLIANLGDVDEAIAFWAKDLDSDSPALREFAQERIDELQSSRSRLEVGGQGHMYQVEIDATPDELLDWDLPLSEQPPGAIYKMKQAINSGEVDLTPSQRFEANDWLSDSVRQKNLSPQQVTGFGGLKNAKMNEALSKHGIKGIKYKDGFSRGGEGGTSNYVIFDDRLISIAKKYGIAIPAAAALLMEQTGEDVTDKYEEI